MTDMTERRGETERRREKRLRYNWPVWFAEDFNDVLVQAQMVDISSGGAAFTCYADKCPYDGQHITTRFSVPRYGEDASFDLENFVRHGRICRVDQLSPFIRRVAVQFSEPLPFKPGEITDTEALLTDNIIESDKAAEAEKLAESEARAMAEVPEPDEAVQTTQP